MISYLILDVDGTLTDGKIYMSNDGEMFKTFNIKDGYAIKNILPNIREGIVPIVITGRKSKILQNRCKELQITELYQGIDNKLEKLKEIMEGYNIEFSELAYIGDDDNDLECMKAIKDAGGIIGCPCDASKNVISICDYITKKTGGDGAVREFIEFLKIKSI